LKEPEQHTKTGIGVRMNEYHNDSQQRYHIGIESNSPSYQKTQLAESCSIAGLLSVKNLNSHYHTFNILAIIKPKQMVTAIAKNITPNISTIILDIHFNFHLLKKHLNLHPPLWVYLCYCCCLE